MSISTRIEAIEQHLTDDYSVLTLAGADLTNVDKNILNLKPTWKERLLYFINNGTDVVWDNWEKVVGEGTTITLNNTEEAPMKIVLKGNTLQNGTPTPTTPQDIHVVSGDNSIVVSNGTQSTSYPITLPEGMFLGWIPNTTYQDKIFKNTPNTTDYDSNLEDNVWYLKKEIGKVVLDENTSMSYNGTAGKFYKENQNICPNYKSNTSMLSNYLLYSSTTWVKNCFGITASNVFWLYIENGPTSLADLRTWLSTHNIEVQYQLATPTYTLIEDTTLISQLEALKSKTGQTNISQTNNDLPSTLNATALKEMA